MSLVDGHSQVKIEAKAEIEPCCTDPELPAKGKVTHKSRIKNGEVERSEFKSRVEVPLPSFPLGIVDRATAMHADARLILQREGVNYAECLLQFMDIESEHKDPDNRSLDVDLLEGTLQGK